MKKSKHPHRTHLGDPSTTQYIDHSLEVVKTNNQHNYELRCTTCNKHVKWATELEYLWASTKHMPRFRTLFWAPVYDNTYKQLKQELYFEKLNQQNNSQTRLIKPEELGI